MHAMENVNFDGEIAVYSYFRYAENCELLCVAVRVLQ